MFTGTLTVEHQGAIEVGTAAQPLPPQFKAEIVLDGTLDTAKDPEQFGVALLGFGGVTLRGSPKLSFVRLATEVAAGATKLTLAAPGLGWQPGDVLVLPDTRQFQASAAYDQREEIAIAAVSGTTVTLSAPTEFAHGGARDMTGAITFLPHVGNETRNVIIRSANPTGTRGHTLFSTRARIDVKHVQFADLGRTTTQPLDSTTFDAQNRVTHVGTNQIGRYAVHAHHLFGDEPSVPAKTWQFEIDGNSIVRPAKWGIGIHASHYGSIQGNLIVGAAGSGITTEDGSETANVIAGNFIVGVAGMGDRGDGRGLADLAWEGTGIWLRGFNNFVRDNVVANVQNGYGYKLYGYYLMLTPLRIPAAPGADILVAGQYTTVNGNVMPIREFSGNEVYAGRSGATYWWVCMINQQVQGCQAGSIAGLKVWHTYGDSVTHYQANKLLIAGLVIRNKGATGWGFQALDYDGPGLTLSDFDIQGTFVGVTPTSHGAGQVYRDGFLNNGTNFQLISQWTSAPDARSIPPRDVTIARVRYGGGGLRIEMAYRDNPVRNLIQSDKVMVDDFNGSAGDSFRAYYSQQAPGFVVPPTLLSGTFHWIEGLPIGQLGLTNAQAWAQFKIAIGGTVAPCLDTRAGITGIVCK